MGLHHNAETDICVSPEEIGCDSSMGLTPKALALTAVSIEPPNTHELSSSLPHGSKELDPKKCNRPPSAEIDSTAIYDTQIARPASELVNPKEVSLIGEGDMGTPNQLSSPALPLCSANSNPNGPMWLGWVDSKIHITCTCLHHSSTTGVGYVLPTSV